MDSFQAHSVLMDLLRRNLSANQIQRISQFCVSNAEHSEHLFSSLLKNISLTNPSQRLNLFYILDHIVKQNHHDYVMLVKSHIDEIVDLIEEDVPQMTRVLTHWNGMGIISDIQPILDKLKLPFLNRDQILKRMEDDRDKQKKNREESWIKPVGGSVDPEFLIAWEKAGPLERKDLDMFAEYQSRYKKQSSLNIS